MSDTNGAPSPLMAIGERLHALLTQLRQTPAWLADEAGVERSTVTRALKGDRQPNAETLALLAPVLGVSLEQLVTGTTAADRVAEAKTLVSRANYDAVVRQMVEYERKANEACLRASEAELRTANERERRRVAENELETAQRDARHQEREARRFSDAFNRAFARIGELETQVRELGAMIDESRRNGRVAMILSGVAACAGIATYLWRSPADEPPAPAKPAPETSPRKKTKRRPEAPTEGDDE